MGCLSWRFPSRKKNRNRKRKNKRSENNEVQSFEIPTDDEGSIMEVETIGVEVEPDVLPPIHDQAFKRFHLRQEDVNTFTAPPNFVVDPTCDDAEAIVAHAQHMETMTKLKKEAEEATRVREFKAAWERLNSMTYDLYINGAYMDKWAIRAYMRDFEHRCKNFQMIKEIVYALYGNGEVVEESESALTPFFRF